MPAAASWPAAIPPSLAGPSGTPAKELAYEASSVACCAGYKTVSAAWAAVAAAAATEAPRCLRRCIP